MSRVAGRAPVAALAIEDLSPLAVRVGLALVTLVASLLALFRLGEPGLWCDEIYTARWTRLSLPQLMDALRTDLHPPLFFVLERAVVARVGESDSGVRLLAALAAVAATLLAFWAFRPALGPRRALVAAALLALSPEFLLYARMARYYSLAVLVTLFAHGVFSRLMLNRGRLRSWPVYAAAAALALYTAYVAAAVLVAHGVWAATRRHDRGAVRRWFASMMVALVLLLPWLSRLREQITTAHALTPALAAGPKGAALALGYWLYSATASERLLPWSAPGLVAFACGVVVLLAGVRVARRSGWTQSLLIPALVALVTAWALVVGFARATPFVSLPARALFLLPFVAALGAVAIVGSARGAPSVWVARAAALGLLCAWGMADVDPTATRHPLLNPLYRTPGREVAEYIATHAGTRDLVLAEDDTGANYYLAMRGFQGTVIDPVDTLALDRALAARPREVLWARLSRDGSARVRPDRFTRTDLTAGWNPMDSTGFAPYEPGYREWKTRLLGSAGEADRVRVIHWVEKAP